MPKFQAVRGTKDILPEEAAFFQSVEQEAREQFARFGYKEIRTPTFESVELFQRSLGDTTDVVQKEMYVFEDRGGRKLALRPEGTAGVVRAFIEHHLSQTTPFCKLFYIGPMFRAERPQAGRYREFWQIGAEYFGNAAPASDAELLLLVQTLFDRLGVTNATLRINSLGDAKCRPAYIEALRAFLKEVKNPPLCEDCQSRIERNPLRALDCKIDGPRIASSAPEIKNFWCDECRPHFEEVQRLLKAGGGRFEIASRLVRGLDYYTRTVFEVTTTALGAQDALAAGGRYDKLVKDVGGPDVPGLGFAMGVERTIQAMKASRNDSSVGKTDRLIFVAAMPATSPQAFELLQELRRSEPLAKAGVRVEGGFFEKKLGAQLTMADRLKAERCVIVGEEELAQGKYLIKALQSGSQETLEKSQLIPHLILDAAKSLD